MKSIAAFALAALVFQTTTASVTQANPVSQAIALLQKLKAQVIKDGEAEQKAFEEYAAWCKDGAKDKEFEIKTATDDIADMEASINQASSIITASSQKISELGSSISTSEADLKSQTEMRKKENDEFVATEAELVDAINTLERATNILSRKLRGGALLQAKVNKKEISTMINVLSQLVDAAALSLHDRQTLMSLAQSGTGSDSAEDDAEADLELGAPAAAVYTSHSGGIIDALENLKEKAESQLSALRNQETNSKHSFEMAEQSLKDQMKFDNQELGQTKTMLANAKETKAQNEGELEVTKKNKAAAEEVLSTMTTDCNNVATDHEETVKNRAEEVKVIGEAIAALTDSTQGAVAETYTPASFLQISGVQSHIDFNVVNMVRKLAKDEQSTALTQLAGRLSNIVKESAATGEDPFAKVKKLISDMIVKLEEEMSSEASHKAYCDKEMGATQQKIDELKYDIEKFSTQIDKDKAESARLKDEIATLQGQVAAIIKAQAKADELRKQEHTEYTLSKADLEQGLEGVRIALKVLREYYATPAEGAALVQQPEVPELHEKGAGVGTSVIGLLEVVESDFGKNLASIEVEEETAATAYQKVSMENKMSKAMKEQDIKYKTKEAASLDKSVGELTSDRDSSQTELDAVLEYSANIRGMCEAKPETYEERVGRRTAEINGLKAALEALEGQAVFLQRKAVLRGTVAVHNF